MNIPSKRGNSKKGNKHLINLLPDQAKTFLHTHASTANFIAPSQTTDDYAPSQQTDKNFANNESIWDEIISKRLRRTDLNVILEGFFLFEWFPRSPGLFHTETATKSRRQAEDHIDSVEDGVTIYNPYGKSSMLDGGIGTVRLKPIEIKNQTYYLMTASSTGICHEGFPLAVPSDYYNKYIEEINDFKVKPFMVVGKLQFVPESLSKLYRGSKKVPQLYLQVEHLIPTRFSRTFEPAPYSLRQSIVWRHPSPRRDSFWVSVAVSFLSDYEGHKRIYATYVSFDPREPDSLDNAVEWMEQDYVIGKYKGKVITDFDQQQANFSDAPFSLEKVMNLRLTAKEIRKVAENMDIDVDDFIEPQKQIINYLTIQGSNYGGIQQGGEHNTQIVEVQNVSKTKDE